MKKRKMAESIILKENKKLINEVAESKPDMLPMLGVAIGIAAGVAVFIAEHLEGESK